MPIYTSSDGTPLFRSSFVSAPIDIDMEYSVEDTSKENFVSSNLPSVYDNFAAPSAPNPAEMFSNAV